MFIAANNLTWLGDVIIRFFLEDAFLKSIHSIFSFILDPWKCLVQHFTNHNQNQRVTAPSSISTENKRKTTSSPHRWRGDEKNIVLISCQWFDCSINSFSNPASICVQHHYLFDLNFSRDCFVVALFCVVFRCAILCCRCFRFRQTINKYVDCNILRERLFLIRYRFNSCLIFSSHQSALLFLAYILFFSSLSFFFGAFTYSHSYFSLCFVYSCKQRKDGIDLLICNLGNELFGKV